MNGEQNEGLLLLPDITGYTEFLNSVEISHSEEVIRKLLEFLIESNQLGLELLEIEGDALFFYKPGEPPSIGSLVEQINKWVDGFHSLIKAMAGEASCHCGACGAVSKLSLKVVGHYGEFRTHIIGDNTKLFGRDVVLAHRLLKNSVEKKEYLLLSWELLKRMGGHDSHGFSEHRESYDHFGEVPLGVLELTPRRGDFPPN